MLRKQNPIAFNPDTMTVSQVRECADSLRTLFDSINNGASGDQLRASLEYERDRMLGKWGAEMITFDKAVDAVTRTIADQMMHRYLAGDNDTRVTAFLQAHTLLIAFGRYDDEECTVARALAVKIERAADVMFHASAETRDY